MSTRLPVLGRMRPSASQSPSERQALERPGLGIAETADVAREAVIAAAESAVAGLVTATSRSVHAWSCAGWAGAFDALERRLRDAGAASVCELPALELAEAARSAARELPRTAVVILLGAPLCRTCSALLQITLGPAPASTAPSDLHMPRDAGPVLRRLATGFGERLGAG